MKISLKIVVSISGFLLFSRNSWSKEASSECPKLTESLCTVVGTKASSDTVTVDFALRRTYSPKPDSCASIDLKSHPDSNCVDKADSAYWDRLKQENKEVYAKYSSIMMDANNPSQAFPYQGDSAWIIMGVVVTKSNLFAIVQDTNLIGAQLHSSWSPNHLRHSQIVSSTSNLNGNWINVLVNGKIAPPSDRSKKVTIGIPR